MSDDSRLLRAVNVTERQDVPAGSFSSWLRATRHALVAQDGADVPCGECNACCRSSYFIHIAPDESGTLARIPDEVLFAAPGRPEGHVLMGYNEHGHCPMLVDDECSIYEYRPRTCRNYDCRIFAAAGVAADEDDDDPVGRRASRWKFAYDTDTANVEHSAVQAAARFLCDHGEIFAGAVGNNATRVALLAIKVYEVFLGIHQTRGQTGSMPHEDEVVDMVLEIERRFESPRGDRHKVAAENEGRP